MKYIVSLKIFSLLSITFCYPQVRAKIPVVFHVIYSTEEQNKEVSDSLILCELKDLQMDFLSLNADTQNVPAEFKKDFGLPQIEFRIATVDPNGNPTSGIVRVKTVKKNFTFSDQIFYADALWDTKKYLNVYIGLIRNGKTEGYTDNPEPWNTPLKDAIGLSYNAGIGKHSRLLTHETGHWLGLLHIFNKNLFGKCLDDGIPDTPLQGRATGTNNCPTHPASQCNHATMFMNFMDYSKCRVMFTKEQVKKMHDVLDKDRKEFLTLQ
ncbi:MAG: hypothetical protein IAF38_09565 [Bacteroidia bacterium]|nr:hypothetical protein [Bacteroidia bacterium]